LRLLYFLTVLLGELASTQLITESRKTNKNHEYDMSDMSGYQHGNIAHMSSSAGGGWHLPQLYPYGVGSEKVPVYAGSHPSE